MSSDRKDPWATLRAAFAPSAIPDYAKRHGAATSSAGGQPVDPPADDLETCRDLADERAAIMEFDGGLTREAAEQLSGAPVDPAPDLSRVGPEAVKRGADGQPGS